MIRHQDAKHYLGQEVIYQRPGQRPEHGTIEGVNDSYVFVLYLGDRIAKATRAEDLSFAAPGMQESYESVTRRSKIEHPTCPVCMKPLNEPGVITVSGLVVHPGCTCEPRKEINL